MTLTLALAGDTMLGRGVAERLRADPRRRLVHPALVEIARSADFFRAESGVLCVGSR